MQGAQTDVKFNKNMLELTSVTKAPAYASAQLVAGITTGSEAQSLTAAIADANTTGILENLSVFYSNSGKAAAGTNAFVTIKFKAKTTDGPSDVDLAEVEMIKLDGSLARADTSKAMVEVKVGAIAPTAVPPAVAEGSGATTGAAAGGSGARASNSVAGQLGAPIRLAAHR